MTYKSGLAHPLPEQMKTLLRDRYNRPIPAFVGLNLSGEPDYQGRDLEKFDRLLRTGACGMCGQVLGREDNAAFVGGPQAAATLTYASLPMHPACAEAALAMCPHMFWDEDLRATKSQGEKPEFLVMVLTRAWSGAYVDADRRAVKKPGLNVTTLLHPRRIEKVLAYFYVDGRLEVDNPQEKSLVLVGSIDPYSSGEFKRYDRAAWLAPYPELARAAVLADDD